jgi:hypothetical protein
VSAATSEIRVGQWRLRARRAGAFGLILDGIVGAIEDDWLHEVLRGHDDREALFELVDREGLVVCKNVRTAHPTYRGVRGRSSRGRLSQGESYHHDGCASDTRPRVVEIRCPHQPTERHTRTAIAPFPATVIAMLDELPPRLRARDELNTVVGRLDVASTPAQWDLAQGVLNRMIRRELGTDEARAYFCAVDVRVGAYREPWELGESRLIANENRGRTMQHRRAYLEPPDGRANGRLLKRWPAEELAAPELGAPSSGAPSSTRCDEHEECQRADG